MKNILITGGLGYVGGRIADYLKRNRPAANIILTMISTSQRLPEWSAPFQVRELDVLKVETIAPCLEGIDTVIHLAAINEIDSMRDPLMAMKVNTEGTYHLLDRANQAGVDRFIYFSTFHVYGHCEDAIITEKSPTRPFHPYATTHRAAEDLVNYFQHYHNMQTVIFRLSNSYGYPMDRYVDRWTLVFNDLCRQAVTTDKIVLKSKGTQHRDFIALEDVARAVDHFIFKIPDGWNDGLYNLGGNLSISILDVAQKISEVYEQKYDKRLTELLTGEDGSGAENPIPVRFSIEKLKETGFSLQGDMAKEIDRSLSLCEGFLDGNG